MKYAISKISITLLLLLLSITANANDFTVQVGAFQELTQEAISKAEQHGSVYQSLGKDNLTRLHIGRFSSRIEAEEKRDQLRNAGYHDAFIARILVSGSTANITNTVKSNEHSYAPKTASQNHYSSHDKLAGLSADERSKAVYVDGQMRIHSNGQFYTLEQYRQQPQY